jgi:hypothetical protein
MNCDQVRTQFDQDAAADASAVFQHLRECRSCAAAHGDAMIERLLQARVSPDMPSGFADRAIATAVAGNARRRFGALGVSAVAASIAAVALTVALWSPGPVLDSGDMPTRAAYVAIVPYEQQLVQVLIEAGSARERATITIELAENLELDGFPNQRVIEWDAELLAGKNLLALPLRLKDQAASFVNVSLRLGDERKAVRVSVEPFGASLPLSDKRALSV